jgi:hypothetical protein
MFTPMTEQQFVEELNLISNEVEAAFIMFHSYEELNRLALTDPDIDKVLNDDPMFWRGYRSTLFTALYMTMSRLFDPVSGTVTIQKLVTSVLANIGLFSNSSLRAKGRQRQGPNLARRLHVNCLVPPGSQAA